jgi:hypothetical protein
MVVSAPAAADPELVAIPIRNGRPAGERLLIKAAVEPFHGSGRTTPGGALLYQTYASGRPTVFVGTLDSGDQLGPWKPLNLIANQLTWPVFSPDGKSVAYSAFDSRGGTSVVRVRSLLTGEDRELSRINGPDLFCAPASRRPNLFCRQQNGPKTDVLSVALDSGLVEKVGSVEPGLPLHATADDQMLWIKRGREGQLFLWEIGTDRETALPSGVRHSSLDGRWYMRIFLGSDNRNAIQIRPVSSGPDDWKHLAFIRMNWISRLFPGQADAANFTSDGKWVVYQDKDDSGKVGLYRVSTSGGEPERLGDYPIGDTDNGLRISDDGRRFLAVPYLPPGRRQTEIWSLENFIPAAASSAAKPAAKR